MVIFAHPDEGEIYAGGTAAFYAGMGHNVKFIADFHYHNIIYINTNTDPMGGIQKGKLKLIFKY